MQNKGKTEIQSFTFHLTTYNFSLLIFQNTFFALPGNDYPEIKAK